MSNTNLLTKAAPIWGASACTREQFGIAPFSPLQGTAVSTVRFAATSVAGYGTKVTALTTDPQAVAMTLAAVRHDDARVPDPRERKR